jgi:hypothetical protein
MGCGDAPIRRTSHALSVAHVPQCRRRPNKRNARTAHATSDRDPHPRGRALERRCRIAGPSRRRQYCRNVRLRSPHGVTFSPTRPGARPSHELSSSPRRHQLRGDTRLADVEPQPRPVWSRSTSTSAHPRARWFATMMGPPIARIMGPGWRVGRPSRVMPRRDVFVECHGGLRQEADVVIVTGQSRTARTARTLVRRLERLGFDVQLSPKTPTCFNPIAESFS